MGSIEIHELGKWFEREADALVLYARQWLDRSAAEDVVQDSFVRLMIERVHPSNVRAWLYRAVRNAALKSVRSRDRRHRREEWVSRGGTQWFEAQAADLVDARQVEAVLRQLADEEREIVTLRIWGGLSLQEIAEVVGTSIATVFRKYRSALTHIRQRLSTPCPTKKN